MKKRTTLVLAGILSVGLIGGVAAHGKFRGDGKHGDHLKHKLTKQLELNDEQAGKLDDFNLAARDAWMQFRETRGETMDQVLQLLESEQLDRDQAMAMVRERTNQLEQQAEMMIAAAAGFTDSLEPDQRAELKSLIQEKRDHRRDHRKRWHDEDAGE